MTLLDRRRLLIGLACSIAIHEALLALIPSSPAPPPTREIVTHVTIAQIVHRRPPAPTPTPVPTPRPIVRTLVAAGTHAAVERIKHAGARRPTPPKSALATPDASVPTGGNGAGAQQGSGAGSTSTVAGNGNGTGANGSGNGAGICGAVDFEASGNATYDPASGTYARSNIVATVYYADGSFERIPLDWTWRWKSEADDPFNTASNAPMLFQFPPAQQQSQEPPAIQYIIAHTTPTGHTKLNGQCPNIPPPPSPHGRRA